jgi:hypothetical protein
MGKSESMKTRNSIWSRLLSVRMTLQNVFYVSYSLPSKKLQPLVPNALELAAVGNNMAFISLVALRSARVRVSSFPVIRFNYNQFNIRTYVIDPLSGQPAVYFIKSGVTSKFISMATNTIGIPWQYIGLTIDLVGSKDTRSAIISGNWLDNFILKVQADANSSCVPSLFQDRKSAVDYLVRPLIGFAGDCQRLVRFTIRHPEVQPESWSLEGLDWPLLKELVDVDNIMKPHSVFFLPESDFSIFLPPQRIQAKR